MIVLDSHCDTPSQIQRLRNVCIRNRHGHVDFPRMKEGGVDASFFALYVSPSYKREEATVQALNLLDGVLDSVRRSQGAAVLALTPEDAVTNKSLGRLSVFLGIENGSAIQDSMDLLHGFHDKGVRYMTLCHSADNLICDSCASKVKTWGGLSPFGRDVIRKMNNLGMMVDVSHISDDSFYDVLEVSTKPVVATHSCCRALSDHPRNMTDEMIVALAKNGGVIQINFYPVFLDASFAKELSSSGIIEEGEKIEAEFIADPSDENKRSAWYEIVEKLKKLPRPSYRKIVDHIDHVVRLVGINHVGIGSDFDGIDVTPQGMEDITDVPKIFEEMRLRGYSEEDISKVAGGNFLRVMSICQSL